MLRWIILGLCSYLAAGAGHDMYYGKTFDLSELDHDVSGHLHILNERDILLTEFNFDGLPPSTYFTVSTTPGSILPDNGNDGIRLKADMMEMNVPLGLLSDATIRITLPDDINMADLVWFSVWCETAGADFGSVIFGDLTDMIPMPRTVGAFGDFNQAQHDVEGSVKVLNTKQIMLIDFHYDGEGPDAYFYIGTTNTPMAGGTIVADENGSMGVLGEYRGVTITITLPDGYTIHDIKWLSVWCEQFSADFGHVLIMENILVPAYGLMEPMYYGTSFEFSGPNGGPTAHEVAGHLHIVDDRHILLTDFTYDGAGPDTFFFIGTTPGSSPSGLSAGGIKIPDENGSFNILGEYRGETILLTLPSSINMMDLVWFSVWCEQANMDFGNVMFGDLTGKIPMPVVIGQLSGTHLVASDDVTVINNKQIMIANFHYDGLGPDAFFYIGRTPQVQGGNTKVPDENGSLEKLREYTGETITITLPDGYTVHNIKWLSVWCDQANANFGHLDMPSPDMLLVPVYLDIDMTNYGVFVGALQMQAHLVEGDVYIVDMYRIQVVNFFYDGQGPDAFFYIGFDETDTEVSERGMLINEDGGKLEEAMGETVVITMPEGKTVNDIVWISVWCRMATANFGNLTFPDVVVEIPASEDLGMFMDLDHEVSGTVKILDERRLMIVDFNFDGQPPSTFFWVGTSASPDALGMAIPDEFGSMMKLGLYEDDTITITLPEMYTWYDFKYLSVWCQTATTSFGYVAIPDDMNLPPFVDETVTLTNCISLHDPHLQVNWEIVGDYIHFEMVGGLEQNGYMSFGRSGSDSRTSMIGADVLVAYMEDVGPDEVPTVDDYYLTQYAQCNFDDGQGACPDRANDGRPSVQEVSGGVRDGITSIRFKRKLTADEATDMNFELGMHYVWAMGILSADLNVTKHDERSDSSDDPQTLMVGNTCNAPVSPRNMQEVDAWPQNEITQETEFHVVIGPAGGPKGYAGITGRASWGIAIYVNELLIPVIHLERGTTYRFTINAGSDAANQAEYHPFYLTEDEDGGYQQKSDENRAAERVIAGVGQWGEPTAVGSLCEYKQPRGVDPLSYDNFDDYYETLEMECDEPDMPGTLVFTPDEDTPDLLYYQCYTHRFLGWKIMVYDEGESPSEPMPDGAEAALPAFATILISSLITLLLSKFLA